MWFNCKSHFWHELVLKSYVSIGLCETKLFVVCLFSQQFSHTTIFHYFRRVDNSAQYFHQVYRHVFQLTCVLILEPESTLFAQLKFILVSPEGKASPWNFANYYMQSWCRCQGRYDFINNLFSYHFKDKRHWIHFSYWGSMSVMPLHPSFAFKCLKMMAFQGFQTQNKNLSDITQHPHWFKNWKW